MTIAERAAWSDWKVALVAYARALRAGDRRAQAAARRRVTEAVRRWGRVG